MSDLSTRVPAGVPTGGQFAAQRQAESDVSLAASSTALEAAYEKLAGDPSLPGELIRHSDERLEYIEDRNDGDEPLTLRIALVEGTTAVTSDNGVFEVHRFRFSTGVEATVAEQTARSLVTDTLEGIRTLRENRKLTHATRTVIDRLVASGDLSDRPDADDEMVVYGGREGGVTVSTYSEDEGWDTGREGPHLSVRLNSDPDAEEDYGPPAGGELFTAYLEDDGSVSYYESRYGERIPEWQERGLDAEVRRRALVPGSRRNLVAETLAEAVRR